MKLRPIGFDVYVRFPQGGWAKETEDGFVRQTGLAGEPFRMDGVVVAAGPRVTDVFAGDTVYGDPRTGRILVVDDVMYHIMKRDALLMRWEYERNGQ